MAKYVRTKYGVYEEKETVGGLKYFEIQTVGNCYYNLCRNDKLWNDFVIKQSDSIEELCDEIVIRHLTSKKPYIADEYQKTQILKDRQKAFEEYGVEEVKCAIWTEGGLIYVAKMNDKGELELI